MMDKDLERSIEEALSKAITGGQGIRITAGIGWCGFWIGLGIVAAALILGGQVIIK